MSFEIENQDPNFKLLSSMGLTVRLAKLELDPRVKYVRVYFQVRYYTFDALNPAKRLLGDLADDFINEHKHIVEEHLNIVWKKRSYMWSERPFKQVLGTQGLWYVDMFWPIRRLGVSRRSFRSRNLG